MSQVLLMKAWMVTIEEGSWIIHASTPGQAKQLARHHTDLGDFDYDYIDLRVTRCKSLDNKPLTLENVETVLYFPSAIDEDGQLYTGEYLTREDYVIQCPCEICQKEANCPSS